MIILLLTQYFGEMRLSRKNMHFNINYIVLFHHFVLMRILSVTEQILVNVFGKCLCMLTVSHHSIYTMHILLFRLRPNQAKFGSLAPTSLT